MNGPHHPPIATAPYEESGRRLRGDLIAEDARYDQGARPYYNANWGIDSLPRHPRCRTVPTS